MKKIKVCEYLKKRYVIVTFFFGVISIGIGLNLLENNIRGIFIGIGTGLITTAITSSIIQYFIDVEKEKEEKAKEKEEILRIDKVLSILLYKYLKYFYCVVVPLKKRKKEDWSEGMPLIKDFKFEDLQNLYLKVSYPNEVLFLTPIELFYKAENDLREYIIKVLMNSSLNHFVYLKEILLKFIESSLGNEHQNKILENLKLFIGDEEMTKIVFRNFNDFSRNWLSEYKKGNLKTDIMSLYVALYYFLKDEIELIIRYNDEIIKIKNNTF